MFKKTNSNGSNKIKKKSLGSFEVENLSNLHGILGSNFMIVVIVH